MTLWSDIAIQQFLTAIGKDLGLSGIDGELGDKGSDSYSRRAIVSFQGDYGLIRIRFGVNNASVKPKKF